MSQRNYPMKCKACSTKDMFFDLGDAYDEGWKSCENGEHCPQHVTKDDFKHDYNMRCAYCREEGLYEDLDDGIESGWWVAEGYDFCPECVDIAIGDGYI